VVIRCICELHNVTSGSIVIYCDCDNALKRIFKKHSKLKPRMPHYDMLTFLRHEINNSPLTWTGKHVYGHQDKLGTAQLTREETLNVEMDNLAKAYWQFTSGFTANPQQRIRGEDWTLWIGKKKIVGEFEPLVREHIGGKRIREYWEEKNRFPMGTIRNIDWEACNKAMKMLKISRRIWVSKHTCGFCGVGKMMLLWKEWDNDKCPRCGHSPEDAKHVWECPCPRATEIWEESLVKLKAWMDSVDTIPGVAELIIDRLREWRTAPTSPDNPIDHSFPGITAAVEAQDTIGWDRFLEGCLAQEWRSAQQTYYQWLDSRRTGLRWASSLITKLLDVAWDQWEHRNSVVHPQKRTGVGQPIPATDDRIREEWAKGTADLPLNDHHHFIGTLDERLSSSPVVRRAWLRNVQAARSNQQQFLETNQSASRALMRTWLTG
jgi:hypothetical protein